MKLKGKIVDVSLDFVTHKPKITLEVDKQINLLNEEFNKIQSRDYLDIEIKEHIEKRTLSMNAYYWVLVTELANVLRTSKDELHFTLLKRYSQRDYVSLLADINPSDYFDYYEPQNTYKNNGKVFKSYLIYKGSRKMDKKEFSILLDGLISECKECDIETLTPDEIAKLRYLEE